MKNMQSKNLKLLFSLIPATVSVACFSLISCTNDYNKLHDNYIVWSNSSNQSGEFSYAYPNGIDKNLQDINNLTQPKLIRIASQNQPEIDFRDSIVLKPTELWYQFEQASSISLKDSGLNESIFSVDNIKRVDYSNSVPDSEKKPSVLYPTFDKGNGFSNPYLFVDSSIFNSINHKSFFEKLKNSNKFIIKNDGKQTANYWVNFEGKDNIDGKKFEVTLQDFKFGLIVKALQNKKLRDKFLKENLMSENQKLEKLNFKENSPYFDGQNIVNVFDSFGLSSSFLEDKNQWKGFIESDYLEIRTKDGKDTDLTEAFKYLLIYSNLLDAIPYEYIIKKYGPYPFSDESFSWFYEYGKTYKNTLYGSYYFVNKNTMNETVLYRNTKYARDNSKWQNQKHLNEIKFKYNTLPIGQSTFNTQSYNAFKQNIISSLNIDGLTLDLKEQILSDFSKYNLSYERNTLKYLPSTDIALNLTPKGKNLYFNDSFANAFYGLSLKEIEEQNYSYNSIFSKESLAFQSMFLNIINAYTIASTSAQDMFLSQAPYDINISSINTSGTNYLTLRDAHANIHKQIILDIDKGRLEKINKTVQFDNKLNATKLKNLTDLNKQISSVDKEIIKKNITKYIDKVLAKTEEQYLEFTLPIKAFNLSKKQLNLLPLIEKEFSTIDERIKAKIVLVDDFDKFNQYFKFGSSIYSYSTFRLNQSTTTDFLKTLVLKNKFEILAKAFNVYKQVKNDEITYFAIFDFFEYLKSNHKKTFDQLEMLCNMKINEIKEENFTFEITQILNKYFATLELSKVVNLINEINNLHAYTINFENKILLANFSKVLYQKYIIKPFSFDGLNYLQDILIKE
ncbi:hypothetical protein JN00_0017 [Metamycoplasma subdolum]|uniref:Lipoprotein n=1 Tax=Metamycoplasma subdolum TaxID=92407 RepID=A0A3M0A1X3_9BACT|nr:hypothetical protein [Metamycoplasma subdolum]RMA78973.1 hypothetical protein JN00_0017 [Metamycoplasma subdolum]WPB50496.1 hypothetical protein R9C05_02715 [Metamycoplasma subdolum]